VSTHDLTLCFVLKAIHTLDAGTHVELKFVVPHPCGDVDTGEMMLRLTPQAGEKYMLGDKLYIHARVL